MNQVQICENFEQLKVFCTGYGGDYKPGNGNLQLNAMGALLEKAKSSLQDVSLAKALYDNVTIERRDAFGEMRARVRAVLATLASVGADEKVQAGARFYARLIEGKRAKARPSVPSDASEQIVASRSVSQTGFAERASHFSKLVQVVSLEPLYKPNEEKLTVKGLQKTADRLQAIQSQVAEAAVKLSNARINRNLCLYHHKVAIYPVAMAVKKYVMALYGYRSDQYKQVSKLRFTKPG
ncbi:MAG: hypothetical protein AB7K37_09825 [Cyclobacteriaceae bacterium]